MVEHTFFNQDMKPAKRMHTITVGTMGVQTATLQQQMQKIELPEEWTEIKLLSAKFDISIPMGTFTLTNLCNPRR